jgi:hypothetical protein
MLLASNYIWTGSPFSESITIAMAFILFNVLICLLILWDTACVIFYLKQITGILGLKKIEAI